jgi:FKBP-type peptidyl-prolyl cis-trans isomerase
MKLKLLTLINIKMKRTILFMAVLFIASTAFVSCESGNNSGFQGFEVTEDGLYYNFHLKGEGTVNPQIGDFITVDMIYATEDTIIFNSKDLPQVMKLPMTESAYKGDIYDGIAMMKVGDSVTFICPADSVFLKLFRMPSVPPQFDSVENIYFHVRLNNIETEAEVKAAQEVELKRLEEDESSKRNEYLQSNYPDAKAEESGLYFINIKKGKGKKPTKGDKVVVNYTGMFLDGNIFDSSVDREPFEFTLGQGQVIKGWDQGIEMMRKGGKAMLVIPSDIAYGPQGRSSIPPYSTLVFEVELLDIKK